MGSRKSSSSASTSSTSQADNRIVAGEGATVLGSGASMSSSMADNSTTTTNTTINASDPGAVQLGKFNAELLGAVAETNTDAVKAIAQLGADGIRQMGASVTDMYGKAGSNTASAWSHTVDASAGLIDRLLTAAEKNTAVAGAVAQSAIGSFQPAENKASDAAVKLGMVAAGGVALMFLMRKS
jgi:hypothetical protein